MVNKSVNNFSNGLNTIDSKVLQPKDTYSYALNAIKEDSINNPSILSNERGFSTYIDIENNYLVIGNIYLGENNYVLFIKNLDSDTNKFNRILLVEDKKLTVKYDTLELNFQEKYIIKGTYRINYKNERIIYFVDGLNEDRVLNIDNNLNTGNIDELSLDIKYKPGLLSSKVINDSNGSLKTGTYEFFASYKSKDNAVTPWFLLNASPVYIIKDNISSTSPTDYINISGVDSNVITTKSITLNLSNLDLDFNKLRIGIIKTINGTQIVTYIDDISYNTITKSYEYTGFAEETPIIVSEFLVEQVKYFASNTITQSSGRLLRANTKQSKINIDYQDLANKIKVDYYIQEEQVLSMKDSNDDAVREEWWKSAVTKYTDTKSLMRDEVYSLGIAFGLTKEGIETEVYHIPGRLLNDVPQIAYENEFDNGNLTAGFDWDTRIVQDGDTTVPRWKVQNTAAKSIDGLVNKLGYYESAEDYPTGFNLPTGKIRHHKIPSSGLEPIYRTEKSNGNILVYKRNIGLSFTNIQIPDILKGNISYARIYITPRDTDKNKSIIGKGIIVNCAYTKINTANNSPSSNYYAVPVAPYNDLADPMNDATYYYPGDSRGQNYTGPNDPKGYNTTLNYYHSFFSPDTLFKKPSLNTDKIRVENEISGIVAYYNTIANKISVDPTKKGYKDTPSNANGGYKRDIFYDTGNLFPVSESQTSSSDVYNVNNTFRSTYKSSCIFNQITKVSNTKYNRDVKKAVYVPFNSNLSTDQLGGMDNPYYAPYGAANVLLELDTSKPVLGATSKEDTSIRFIDNNTDYIYPDDSETKNKTIKGTFHFHPIANPTAVYRYGSIKRNNPTQYGDVTGLEYTPTDLVISDINLSGNLITNEVKGLVGDVWVDLFSIKRIRYGAKRDYTYGSLPEVHVGISSFFTESTINHRLRYGDADNSYFPQSALSNGIKQSLDYSNKAVVEKDNFYKYNEDFTKHSSKQNYSPDNIDNDLAGISDYSTRIVYSEKLLDEARIDAYRSFLANNYRDLPKNKGFITHLFTKGQELYAITRDSIWRLFTSTETIKSTTENNITVGTGEFMSLDPVELISIDGGFAGSSSKNSLVETPYGYFFIDRHKGKFILFTGEVNDISMLGVNQFIQDNFELTNLDVTNDFDLPLLNQGYLAGYDPELKRLLITKLNYKLSENDISNYKGEYNSSNPYQTGDIYSKQGLFYKFISKTQEYQLLIESLDLSDFESNQVDNLLYTYSNNTHLTKLGDGNLVYNSNTIGGDNFTITMGCNTTTVNVTVEDAPDIPDYTTSIQEKSPNNTNVITVNANYPSVIYSIQDGNNLGIFSIDSNTGQIKVNDNTNLLYNTTNQVVLTILATAGSLTSTGTVTINITALVSNPVGVDKTITILNTASGLITTLDKAIWTNPPFPKPSLVYEQLTDTDFSTELDIEDTMIVLLKEGIVLDPSITNQYVIQYRVYSSNDETINDTFTLTINVLYDRTKLVAEPYEYTCLVDPIYSSDIQYSPYEVGGIYNQMRDALAPLNSKGYTYAYKNSATNHTIYSMYFLFYDEAGGGSGQYYSKNAFGDKIIGKLTNPQVYPSSTVTLYGTGRGKSIGGYITTNGDIHLNSNDDKAIVDCSGMVSNDYVLRLYNTTYSSEFTQQGIV